MSSFILKALVVVFAFALVESIDWEINTPALAVNSNSNQDITWSIDESSSQFPNLNKDSVVEIALMDGTTDFNNAVLVKSLANVPLRVLKTTVQIPSVPTGSSYFYRMGTAGSFKYSGAFTINGGAVTTTTARTTATSSATSTTSSESTRTSSSTTATTSSNSTSTSTRTSTRTSTSSATSEPTNEPDFSGSVTASSGFGLTIVFIAVSTMLALLSF